MLFLWTPWFDRDRDKSIADQLAGPLIKTDNMAFRIIGFLIEIQDIFHTPDELIRHLSISRAASMDIYIKFKLSRTHTS